VFIFLGLLIGDARLPPDAVSPFWSQPLSTPRPLSETPPQPPRLFDLVRPVARTRCSQDRPGERDAHPSPPKRERGAFAATLPKAKGAPWKSDEELFRRGHQLSPALIEPKSSSGGMVMPRRGGVKDGRAGIEGEERTSYFSRRKSILRPEAFFLVGRISHPSGRFEKPSHKAERDGLRDIHVLVLDALQEPQSASNLRSSALTGTALGCRDRARMTLGHESSVTSRAGVRKRSRLPVSRSLGLGPLRHSGRGCGNEAAPLSLPFPIDPIVARQHDGPTVWRSWALSRNCGNG
jgi:hypothetical protein